MMYDVSGHGLMLRDPIRVKAYAEALKQVVTPDSVVLDLGTGTGFFALLACQYGARHVYAIEPDPAIYVGLQSAKDNGYTDRITFIQALSQNVTLPEKVDILITDLRGQLPLVPYNVPVMRDAHERFLKPTSIILPRQDTVWVAPVLFNPKAYQNLIDLPWLDNTHQLDLSAGRQFVVNSSSRAQVGALNESQMIGEAQVFARLDYYHPQQTSFHLDYTWNIPNRQSINCYLLWFDCDMADGIGFSGHPLNPNKPTIFGQMPFFLEQPITAEAGDQLVVQFKADLISSNYIFTWKTDLISADGQSKAKFQQSTSKGDALATRNSLRPKNTSSQATLNLQGQVFIKGLELLQVQPANQVSINLFNQFADYFTNESETNAFVQRLKERYF